MTNIEIQLKLLSEYYRVHKNLIAAITNHISINNKGMQFNSMIHLYMIYTNK